MALATISSPIGHIACKYASFPGGTRSSPQTLTEAIRAPGVDGELHQTIHKQWTEFECDLQTSETSLRAAVDRQHIFEQLQSQYITITWPSGSSTRRLKNVKVLQSSAYFRASKSAGAGVDASETHTVFATLMLRCTEQEEAV